MAVEIANGDLLDQTVEDKAYFNICTGGIFAPLGPLLAPPLRKNCPTSNWAQSKN